MLPVCVHAGHCPGAAASERPHQSGIRVGAWPVKSGFAGREQVSVFYNPGK